MSIKLLKQIHNLLRTVTNKPFYIVGGAVRDTLYDVEPKDYDCVLCAPHWEEVDTFIYLSKLAEEFSSLGFPVKLYQSYGLNMGEAVDPSSFQAMFSGCLKVSMKHAELDILVSHSEDIQSHVMKHDCNMNMVWFDGKEIRWEHFGAYPKVETLVFNPNASVPEARIARMDKKRHALISASL